MDVILGDIDFTFPLTKAQYASKDFIVWGNYDAVLAGDTYNGGSEFLILSCALWACTVFPLLVRTRCLPDA